MLHMKTPDQLILDYIGCWKRKDAEALVSMFSSDGRYTDPNFPEKHIGPEELMRYASAFFSAIPDIDFSVVQFGATAPDGAALRWVMRGTQAGPFGALPAKGGRFCLPGCDFIRLRDGLIVEAIVLFDQKLFLEQAGYTVEIHP